MVTEQDLLEVKDIIINDIKHFQMADWKKENDCGTAFCIGGWLHEKGKISIPAINKYCSSSYGSMPDLDSDDLDTDSDLFNVDRWTNFISKDTLDYIDEVTTFDSTDEYELEAHQIDELDDDIRIKLISMVIDDYIAVYYPEGEDNG